MSKISTLLSKTEQFHRQSHHKTFPLHRLEGNTSFVVKYLIHLHTMIFDFRRYTLIQ